jgi:Predicted membrane protein (DUF2339)
MTASAQEERIATLERRLSDAVRTLDGDLGGIDARLRRIELGFAQAPSPAPRVAPQAAGAPFQAAGSVPSDAPPASPRRPSGVSLGDLVGGRLLAWLGGLATLLGIVLFLALAISHGWIDEQARVLLATAASAVLMAAGVWLHDHRGRTEAAVAMVGAATAGLFASLIVASAVYHLIPGLAALAGSLLVGAGATVLAIRWAGRAIAGLGLLGAMTSGVMVGASLDPLTISILAVTATCAMWVAARRRWGWLALATVATCAPQWSSWMLEGQPAVQEALGLVAFAGLGLLGAAAVQRRAGEERLDPWAAAALGLSACASALVGRFALGDDAGAAAGDLWLAALACAHLGLAVAGARRRFAVAAPLRELALATGIVLADVAFGLSASGLTLAVGWSASAVALAWLGRRGEGYRSVYGLGAGAQIALALMRALLESPPGGLAAGTPGLAGLLSVASLAAGCLACAHLTGARRPTRRIALNGLGLVAIAYLTASALDGSALSAAWAFEGLALMRFARGRDEVLERAGALAFIGASAAYTLAAVASPLGLVDGGADLGASAVALGALAAVALRAGTMQPPASRRRAWALIGAGGSILYLASLASVTLPADGQVALSALWGASGVLALLVGLRANVAPLRTAALGLLLATVAKVFLYDLSTLTSVARVVSFMVLGLLLLLGAFAYQRLRPPPLPDMRSVHPSAR